MKIGILTFHRSYNYGAFMQCYALSSRLKKDFPDCQIEVIDYATKRMYQNYDISVKGRILSIFSGSPSFKLLIKRAIKLALHPYALKYKKILYKAFERDLECLPLSDYHFISDDYPKFFDDIKGKYDVVIVGSDSVWEFISYPFPNAYYLMENLGAVKMSYAASADRMHINMITQNQRNMIKQAMVNMRYIGIRDVATENFLCKICPEIEKHHNCDPTFLLEMELLESEKISVKNKLLKAGIDFSKPIIGFMCGDRIADRIISKFGNKYQYVSVYCNNRNVDVCLNDLTPREWAIAFSFFVLTVTRFFHGTILSLKNEIPTLTIDDWKMVDETHTTKLEDLYNRLELKEHYCKMTDFFNDNKFQEIASRTEQFIYNTADKEKIKAAVAKEAENYYDFRKELRGVIENAKK